MSIEMFLSIYVALMIVLISIEIYLLSNNKAQHIRESCKALKNIFESYDANDTDVIFKAIVRFYEEYVQERPQITKYFPNLGAWLDAIIFRISCGYKYASILQEYRSQIERVKDEYERTNPFSKCEKFQQGILNDISKIKTEDNRLLVQNIIDRTEEEFIRLSSNINENKRMNTISIAVGIIGIVVSILMAIVKI